jgi:hypothetical protein
MAGLISAVTDHAGPDPIQGYDVDVWVQDASDGSSVLLGSFTSIVVTIRNATEAYLTLNERIPRYLDGEVQIAWVMEKGLLDINVLKQSFGFAEMVRTQRFNRSPRFTITFSMNTYQELKTQTPLLNAFTNHASGQQMSRDPDGRFTLVHCKVDSWHFAATSGKQVVATQWQGVCEGIRADADPIQGEAINGASTAV